MSGMLASTKAQSGSESEPEAESEFRLKFGFEFASPAVDQGACPVNAVGSDS